MFENPNPSCNKQCSFTHTQGMTTLVYYIPIYDKNGVNTNPDGNTTTSEVYCSTCKTKWKATTQYGKTTFTLLNNDR